ncbi:hypothetical protein EDC04DRAFT_3093204 [Pisolithus marmoratus]|nr:hypothetical protein EDC04DRAFT_3093204 [Pisolithus marmoratus]
MHPDMLPLKHVSRCAPLMHLRNMPSETRFMAHSKELHVVEGPAVLYLTIISLALYQTTFWGLSRHKDRRTIASTFRVRSQLSQAGRVPSFLRKYSIPSFVCSAMYLDNRTLPCHVIPVLGYRATVNAINIASTGKEHTEIALWYKNITIILPKGPVVQLACT